MKKLLGAFCMAICFLLSPILTEAEDVLRIGRIYPYMPEIKAEVSGANELKTDEITAMLGSRQLDVQDIHTFNKQTDSSKIYILLDVSTSMAERFHVIKEQLAAYTGRTGEKDQLILLTFGKGVRQVLNGTETKEAQRQSIMSLAAEEDGTVLFKALDQAYEMSMSGKSEYSREYIIVITDGVDFQMGNQTYNEIGDKFNQHVLPIHALCAPNATKEAADNLGELCRKSGGSFRIFSDGGEAEGFAELEQTVDSVQLLTLRANSNEISGQDELLSIKAAGKEAEQNVLVTRFEPDTEAPGIVKASVGKESKVMIVQFSEAVGSGDWENAIRLLNSKGEVCIPQKTEYVKETKTASIYFEKPLSEGTYTVKTQGITDISQEKNPLKVYTGKLAVKDLTKEKNTSIAPWLLGVLCAGVLIILGIILALILINKKKKAAQKAIESEARSELNKVYQGEVTPVIEREFYQIKQAEGKHVTIHLSLGNGDVRHLKLQIREQLIFGRGKTCDVSIEDERLSRQHFCVKAEQEKYIIADMKSTNGTKLNGIPLKGRQILKTGDKIRIGQTDIVWMG